jgi:hypothetical protein
MVRPLAGVHVPEKYLNAHLDAAIPEPILGYKYYRVTHGAVAVYNLVPSWYNISARADMRNYAW